MAPELPAVEDIIQRYVARVRERVPVEAVYLFGSHVRGEATQDSDIDLAVISPAFGLDRYREMVLLTEACLPDALDVEAVPFSVDEFRTLPQGSLLREAVHAGRRVA